jgi:hypothetical protein
VQICERHKNGLREALRLLFIPTEGEPLWQCEALILANAVEWDQDLADSPPEVCPMCQLSLRDQAKWTAQAARSIQQERKNRQ